MPMPIPVRSGLLTALSCFFFNLPKGRGRGYRPLCAQLQIGMDRERWVAKQAGRTRAGRAHDW